MTYELAKQLKDAGFPQPQDRPEGGSWHIEENEDFSKVMIPTLSELIEACSKLTWASFSLEQHSNDWRAGLYRGKKQFECGSTPEEAVAKLWLALSTQSVDKK